METGSLPINQQNTQPAPETTQETASPPEPQLPEAILNTELPLPLLKKDDARDIYDLGEYNLAVYTDRASVFGVPIEGGIPERGIYMARLTSHWMAKTNIVVPNHFKAFIQETNDLNQFLKEGESFQLPENLAGRCLVYKKIEPLEADFEVWGYLTGPAWKEYSETGNVFGHPQISGLLQSQCIPGSILVAFTTDAEGNRKQLSDDELVELTGPKLLEDIKSAYVRLYNDIQRALRVNGKFIVAHMKLIFGKDRKKAYIADDILTPDSTCYWDMQHYKVGSPYYSFESQTLKAWLMHTSWKQRGPLPQIPANIMLQTIDRYRTLCERITGK
ncbi:MAG: phosphoribosylaminoimidazolesuccinocarboxamide synthase [Dehalococcoidales bacterium]|jgi:phosphoribosylaminoimidazole-succinocarboxamide synthase|nr:phosphoribosylaminoimidazolesuccinocarboxamide synthase [Dehalococcoidales bacterium]MDD5605368.1 phosphoribosylaminoimidazolesuccinocarboxamide synthase [Dehalococcoidales bacterium]MDX9986862.1 phosphoribosylaminoimidazolesuccinocarboxamide synthase [Dehalococcoidales bacterium]NLE90494.1 hypothetical protein [Dehalococcoidales bacterium]